MTIEELIEQANSIEDEQQRLEFVMNYFLQNVEYDYTYLLIKGYLQGKITGIKAFTPDCLIPNPFSKGVITAKTNGETVELNDTISYTSVVVGEESDLLKRLDKATKECNGDFEKYKKIATEILEEELYKHIDKREIVEKSVQRFIDILSYQFENNYGKLVTKDGTKYLIGRDIKTIILYCLLEPEKYFPPVIENDILKRGVCIDYSKYLKNLLEKVGLKAVRLEGISELGHSWLAVSVNKKYKSVDLTRAVFIRDGFLGIPKDQTSKDWLIRDFKDTFDMQETRKITGIVNDENELVELQVPIDKNNFNQEELEKLLTNNRTK